MIKETSPTAIYEAFVKYVINERPYGSQTTGMVSLIVYGDLIARKSYRSKAGVIELMSKWNKMYRLCCKGYVEFLFEWKSHGINKSRRIAYKSQIEVLNI